MKWVFKVSEIQFKKIKLDYEKVQSTLSLGLFELFRTMNKKLNKETVNSLRLCLKKIKEEG